MTDEKSSQTSEPAGTEAEAGAGTGPGLASSGRRRVRAVVQGLGFLAGVALMVWCVGLALEPGNRAQLARLRDAPAELVVALLGLSALTIVLNGLIFWVVLRPVRRLRASGVVAVNALATFLAYLPFKLSMVSRVVVHNRRDGVPVVTIVAWMVVAACVLSNVVTPVAGISAWRKGIDSVWLACVPVGIALTTVTMIVLARVGLRVVDAARARGGRVGGVVERLIRLRDGLVMAARVRTVLGATGLRTVDVVVVSARFAVAAALLGVPLAWEDALLLGITFFFVGAASPFGEFGTREAATVGVAGLLGIDGAGPGAVDADAANPIVLITLFVSGSESIVRVVGAGLAVIWLRPDRWVRARAGSLPPPTTGVSGPAV